ncbi:MAG: RIP metalloprotease RseP [Paracoccus sp. (in: a-proteobacteria)]|uniref:RIP metalloprotease RseP n=1 Tax=Paracoccus sp. TaxID=267 RepID=UPI0026E08AAA|nr:RIP metalloprotease RseP [Paracoccus sp. (in: a-proteobacteria)]MDO5622393.1 RIP metalloprotease RseP [Paracoccus sp. (in: a-proteobacteria)]
MVDFLSGVGGSLWTLAAFVVALAIIVTVHEFGHYIVARWSGIRAEVFSVGMGPRLWGRRDRHGTLWQIAALPIGGYVRFLGDENMASAGDQQANAQKVDPALRRQTLGGAPLWARVATVSAGPVFNFVLSTLIFAGFLMVQGVPRDEIVVGKVNPLPVVSQLQPGDKVLAVDGHEVAGWRDFFTLTDERSGANFDWLVERDGQRLTVTGPDPMPARIGGVTPRSAAASAGLREGEVVTAINGQPVQRFRQLYEMVTANEGAPLELDIWSPDGRTRQVSLTPKQQDFPTADGGFERRWLIGVSAGQPFQPETEALGPLAALQGGWDRTWGVITSSVTGMAAMIGGQISTCNMGGAISIAESTGQMASSGGADFIWWIAVLSAAIGFLNLLPIPVLDGGHLAFYAYEAVFRRPPSERAVHLLTMIGMALVLSLMIFGLSNDLFCP